MKQTNYLIISILIFITCHMRVHPGSSGSSPSYTCSESVNLQLFTTRNVSEEQQNCTLSPPYIISPEEGQVVNGTVCINWTKAIDSHGHVVRYSVLTSPEGSIWKTEASDVKETYFYWDTTGVKWYKFFIMVEAECSAGLKSSDSREVTVENYPPELRFLLILLLFLIIFFLLVGIIVYRKRRRVSLIKGIPSINNLKTIKLGLCLGSFTDRGLVIKEKNANCPFSLEQIQPMLEYSAALHQHGKTDTMYGPIPITSLKEDLPEMELSQTHWHFVTYWMNVRDSSVEDPRIKKLGGVVSAVLMFFYPKQIDHMVMVTKNNISHIFKALINPHTDISKITIEELIKIEERIIKLLIS
ncbi:MAG: hypothetical protein ACFFDT_05625 [Candidatus Hodarchaeota archaeon]